MNKNKGFIGLLVLLVVVAIIAILFLKSAVFKNFGEGRAMPSTGFNAIDSAENARNLIEENSRKAAEQ